MTGELEAREHFYGVIMPRTRADINELIARTDPEFKKAARLEYLKEKMTDAVAEAWSFLDMYHDYRNREKFLEMLLAGEKARDLIKEIVKLQGEIIALRQGNDDKRVISDDDIRRAREYFFAHLIEFKRDVAKCPFHEDRTPSLHYYSATNTVHCFSCNQTWDTIAFLMERDGLTFREAVRRLCE